MVLTEWIVVGWDLFVYVVGGGALHGPSPSEVDVLSHAGCHPGNQGHDRLAPDAVVAQGVDPLQAPHLLFAGQVKVLEDDVGVLAALPLQVNLTDRRPE